MYPNPLISCICDKLRCHKHRTLWTFVFCGLWHNMWGLPLGCREIVNLWIADTYKCKHAFFPNPGRKYLWSPIISCSKSPWAFGGVQPAPMQRWRFPVFRNRITSGTACCRCGDAIGIQNARPFADWAFEKSIITLFPSLQQVPPLSGETCPTSSIILPTHLMCSRFENRNTNSPIFMLLRSTSPGDMDIECPKWCFSFIRGYSLPTPITFEVLVSKWDGPLLHPNLFTQCSTFYSDAGP